MADQLVEDKDLGSTIASEIAQARSYDRSELASKRARAIEYLRGEMNDTPPRPNGSKQTDRTFADTVGWVLPGVVQVFAASDRFVRYTKVKSEDEAWERDATDFTNHSFWNEGGGYSVIYDVIYDALTLGNGVICSYWEPERIEPQVFRNKTEMELAALLEDGWKGMGMEPKPGKPRRDLMPDELTSEYVEAEVPTWTVKLGKVRKPGKICDLALKPENLLINSTATTIEGARFTAYCHDDKTRSDLMEMADDYDWDKEVVANLPSWHNRANENEVTLARETPTIINNNSPLKSSDPINLYQVYIRADIDNDGIAELVQAWYAGEGMAGTLLGFEEWDDEVPWTDIRCFPVPHRFDADSMFDRTQDIQRVKTVVLRGMLDNGYAVALPMWEAEAETVENPDILANPRFGATIWRKKGSMATAPIQPHLTPFVGDKLNAILSYMDEMTAKRTGVNRTTMALDPEALQNQTATADQNNRDAAYSQIELVALNCAQYGGFTKHFSKRIKIAIKYQKIREIPDKKADSGFREINPELWDPNMAVNVNTGLGTGSRDRDMAMLDMIMQRQVAMAIQLKEAGLVEKALEMIPKIFKTAVQMAESSGLHDPQDYYPEFTDEDLDAAMQQAAQMAQQPPIEVQIEQARAATQRELNAADGQITLQVEAGKNQLAAQQAQVDAAVQTQREAAQLEADMQTAAADREKEITLETLRQAGTREQIASNERIAYAGIQKDLTIAREQMANAVKVASMKPKPQPGKSA